MDYTQMKKEIDRLTQQNISLRVSLQRRDKEVNKYKSSFEKAVYCNRTMIDENELLKEEIEDLKAKVEILTNIKEIEETIKEQENGTKI